MDRAKYIVFVNDSGFEEIVVFSGSRSHDFFGWLKPISAGFVGNSYGDTPCGLKTYGKSLSLDLDSREEDQALLDRLLKK